MTIQGYRRDGSLAGSARRTRGDGLYEAAHGWRQRWTQPDMADAIVHDVSWGSVGGWNLVYVVVLATCVWWARSTGDGWLRIAAAIVLAVALGGAVLIYAITVGTPRALRRHEELLRSHLAVRRLPARSEPAAAREAA